MKVNYSAVYWLLRAHVQLCYWSSVILSCLAHTAPGFDNIQSQALIPRAEPQVLKTDIVNNYYNYDKTLC